MGAAAALARAVLHCSARTTTHGDLAGEATRASGLSAASYAGEGPGRTNVMATPSRENLQRLGALLTDGTLRVQIKRTYELAQAPGALSALTGEHTQGKLAIRIR